MDLSIFEFRKFSQNGEDGITMKLVELCKKKINKFCVEFGAENGIECNTRILKEDMDWDNVWLDCNYSIPEKKLYKEYLNKDNVVEIFESYNIPINFGCLSIDIDYNDFYLLGKILKKYKPSIIVCEYNATHLPNEDKVVKYVDRINNDNSNYFGASLLSLTKLCNLEGYSLVYSEKRGINAFYIRDEDFDLSLFKNLNNVESLYNTPKYGNGPNGGHRQDSLNREYVYFEEAITKI